MNGETFEKMLRAYKDCQDVVIKCDLETEEGWIEYRDAQEGLYIDIGNILRTSGHIGD